MRIPPDIRQSLFSVGSIAVFAVLLVLHDNLLIYAYIGVTFAGMFGYTIYKTSKTIPVMKRNAKEAQQVRKDYKDKVVFRQTAKDIQQFFKDYEMEKLKLSKKMLMIMMIPFGILIVIYAGVPLLLKLIMGISLSRIQIAELYIAAALGSVGTTLVIRRKMGLNTAAFGQGAQLIYAPKAYVLTEKGVIFEPQQRMPDVEFNLLKFPAKIHKVEKDRNFVELETLDTNAPQQLKMVRLYSKDVDRLTSLLKNYASNGNQELESEAWTLKTSK
jgi:uncharacterized membrane protein